MKAFALVIIPLFAGLAGAQEPSRIETRTTTTKTSWNGTLVDAACQSTRTVHSRDSGVTTTQTETVDCPVTTTTNTFGLVTPDGRFIRFDNPSNSRVVEIVRSDRAFHSRLADRAPLRVSVIGSANGDVAVVESLNTEAGFQATAATESNVIFDVKYHDDRGKLVITSRGVNFEDLSDAKHSRSWSYGQIKELKRDGSREIKIEPHSGSSYEFRLEGRDLSDAVYKMIGDRIAAARSH